MSITDRIPDIPPRILPLPEKVKRPLWSVMIPVYNCIQFLEEAIESVLQQYPGEGEMEIEVVDDCSTDGDVGALVEKKGRGIVKYYRNKKNMGSLRNFETCINRAKGHYIHLLHGDDYVLDGFYTEIEHLFDLFPTAGAAFTDFDVVDEKKNFLRTEAKLQGTPGVIDDAIGLLATTQRIQTPAIVVRRNVYEKLGSFYAVASCEDWLMWVRIAANYPVLYSPKNLACYRSRSNSLTSNSFVTGQYITDITKVINLNANLLPLERKKKLTRQAKKHFAIYAAWISHEIYHDYKNKKAAMKMVGGAVKLHLNITTLYLSFILLVKMIIRYKE